MYEMLLRDIVFSQFIFFVFGRDCGGFFLYLIEIDNVIIFYLIIFIAYCLVFFQI
jgi:hypothetical protein